MKILISGHSCTELEVVASFYTKTLSKNYVVKWLDEAGIGASACARKLSLYLRSYLIQIQIQI